jgi:ribonucleoside-triphosphate reductase (thioredoxin)
MTDMSQFARTWSNLAKVVYKRTYARKDTGKLETWKETVDRVLAGNFSVVSDTEANRKEKDRLRQFMLDRKGGPAGRGYWFSGSPSHSKIGGAALNNCWFVTSENWESFLVALDLLMLGGGVGLSVEHRYVSKLPRVKKDVSIVHKKTKDADFIVPDSREGWIELTRRVYEAFFVTGKSFSYSTVCIRDYGETISGFGGTASGPLPLIKFIENLSNILNSRAGRAIRPLDAADLLCCSGEMVVSGNVRRSAIIILGDAFDKDYLKAKRWDLGPVPTYRAYANLSVVCDDIDDLHPLFWRTYEDGEPFGLVNRKNMQRYGRMGEAMEDDAVGVNPCAEATLEPYEPCNLQEIALANLEGPGEFIELAKLLHRYGKRVTLEHYHIPEVQKVVSKNRRVGTGITGCLESPLFSPDVLDDVYAAIQKENVSYSNKLGIPKSIRTTVVKPSGTMSKLLDCRGEGIHPAFSRHMIQRVRFAANDKLVPLLREAGHPMEPVVRFDGSLDPTTIVVDFYLKAPEDMPCADEGFDTWKQLDTLLMAQKHWADQAVSVTVYYRKEELPQIKAWLGNNLQYLKSISFLCHNDHGFKQAPKEAIDEETFGKLSANVKPINIDAIDSGSLDNLECEGGVCPIK